MKMNLLPPDKGRILLSEPFLHDSFFKRSVILLAENSDKGSMGFILNKPVGYQIHELIAEFPEFNSPVYFGGPVESNSLFFIHTVPHLNPDLCWGIFCG
jgi:putative transcriptional regulator